MINLLFSAFSLTTLLAVQLGTVHFLRGRGAGEILGGGGHPKKNGLKGGPSKKNKGKGGFT